MLDDVYCHDPYSNFQFTALVDDLISTLGLDRDAQCRAQDLVQKTSSNMFESRSLGTEEAHAVG